MPFYRETQIATNPWSNYKSRGVYLHLPNFGKESVCGHKTGSIRPDKTILIRIGYLSPSRFDPDFGLRIGISAASDGVDLLGGEQVVENYHLVKQAIMTIGTVAVMPGADGEVASSTCSWLAKVLKYSVTAEFEALKILM